MRINIFKNQYKDQDKHPDWRGKMEVDELTADGKKVVYKVAGWNNKTKDGNDTYIGLIIERELVDPEPEIKTSEEEIELPF
tara:strand:+ start:5605 stop:5847 length:243 start_codon:yes stop_codon:yes gene_type:complete